jgi:hypothetical protein
LLANMVEVSMITLPRPIISVIAGCALFFSLAAGVAGRAGADDYERGFRALEDGRFGEAGAIGRITPEQAFSVVAATLHRQGAAGAEQPVT